ncbi:MAG: glycosyltransferase family 4 protein [Candidatus Peregrinibacteria bacterium]|nr:glycosyltransferase family 4 protein [Candidatus Peregrinibacteria bacterium]
MPLHSLMFGWEYPPRHSGGLGVACQGLVRGLLKTGVRVTLVLPRRAGSEEEGAEILTPESGEFSVVTVPSDLQPYDGSASYATRRVEHRGTEMEGQLYGPDLSSAVANFTDASVALTQNLTPDVVHAHDWMTYEAGIRTSDHHGVPFVAHIHATELDRTDFHPNERIFVQERRGFLHAQKIIAVSDYTKRILTEHYGIPAEKIAVVHNAHAKLEGHRPTQIFSQYGRRKPPLVLFVGRLTVQKNPLQFLDVASRVHALRPDVQFVMAGDGPLLPALIERTCAMGLERTVFFAGRVSREEGESLYHSADCFVMPSLSEPFGLVALEAAAHGVPIILSKHSGVSEVIDHCFKVDFWDGEKMADCILTILREEPLAMQLKAEAPRILTRLTWQRQAERVRAIYEDTIRSLSTLRI